MPRTQIQMGVALHLLLCIGIGLLFAAAEAQAQQAGIIAGVVLDPFGARAANVAVQARQNGADPVYRATTDASGAYRLTSLPPGAYTITIAVAGLKAFERKDIAVQGTATTAVDIRLEEGSQLSTLGEDPLGIVADRARHAPPTGPTPRTADGKPDFSGIWWAPTVVDPGKPEWLPGAQKIAAERVANNRKDSPQTRCLPSAVLRRGPLVQVVQSKAVIVEITDDDSPGFHQIYLSRPHPKEFDPLWYGDSVGAWEGDVLVVDRIGFLDEVWLDQDSHPHSDKLHVVERYRRPDLGHLDVEVTVEDPGVLARPYTLKRTSELAPTEEIREFICAENNSDLPHLVGN